MKKNNLKFYIIYFIIQSLMVYCNLIIVKKSGINIKTILITILTLYLSHLLIKTFSNLIFYQNRFQYFIENIEDEDKFTCCIAAIELDIIDCIHINDKTEN